jgi:tetratricopeptide (TPR) repeat protein
VSKKRGLRGAADKRSHLNPVPAKNKTPEALYQAGLVHLQAGRYLDAQICCRQALAANSNHADTLHLMGLLSVQAGQQDAAIEWIGRAIQQNPKTEYLANLGVVLKKAERLDDAFKVFEKAIELKADDPQLWCHLAGALVALGRRAEALLGYQHALKLDPHHWESAYQGAVLLEQSERFEEALVHFDLCNQLRPDHVQALQGRARALHGLKRFEECLTDVMRAHTLDPADPVSCNNAGSALLNLERPEEALQWFDRGLALQPNSTEILRNKAFVLGEVHRFKEALDAYDRVEALDPTNAKCVFARSHLQLLTGDFAAGWRGREARWKVPKLPIIYPNFSQPGWLGSEDIAGKTLLIYSDEGLGDTIQFVRYLPMLIARGAHVILVVQDAVYPLLSGMSGIQECRPSSAGFPAAFDMYCPLFSLPLAFNTRPETIPPAADLPPLASSRVQAWENRLGPHDRLRVGLVWSGNPKHKNDGTRSIPLRTMSGLFDIGAQLVSLQKDPRPEDKAFLSEQTDIVDLTANLTDFAQTAALISCLDLVITVDTGVAHLAAALGCPTWILISYRPDWRWMLDRDDSPWYPTARLFRQTATREYASVVERVRTELMAQVSKFG